MLDLVFREKLQELVAGEVFFDEPLSRYTSFGVGGAADAVVFPHNREELKNTIAYLVRYGLPFKPLGNGTNIIVRDGGYRGIIVCLKKLTRYEDGGGRQRDHHPCRSGGGVWPKWWAVRCEKGLRVWNSAPVCRGVWEERSE